MDIYWCFHQYRIEHGTVKPLRTQKYIYILNKEITKQHIDKQTVNEQTLENGESIFI